METFEEFEYALSLCCHSVEFDTLDGIANRVRWAEDGDREIVGGHLVEGMFRWSQDADAWVDAEAEVRARVEEQRAALPPPALPQPQPWRVMIHGPQGGTSWWSSADTEAAAHAKAAELPAHLRPTVEAAP